MFTCGLIVLLLFSLLNGIFAQPYLGPPPPVLVPRQGDVWNAGELRTVEWGLDSDIPVTNSSDGTPLLAFVILAYSSGQAGLNHVLLGRYQLASGFPLSQMMVNIIVPEVPTRKDYAILMNAEIVGTSWSDAFEIFNAKDPQGTGAAPTSISVITAPPISVTVVLPTQTSNEASMTTVATSPTFSSTVTGTSSIAAASQTGISTGGAASLSHNNLLLRVGVVLAHLLLTHIVM